MEPNQRKRFSFTDAAAQQPERQRFSFSQKTKAEEAIPSYSSLFPTKQRLVDLAMAPRVAAAPKSQTKNEFNSILEAGKSQTISQGAPSLSDRARRNLPKGLTEPFIGTGLQANTPGGNSDTGFIGWNFEELTKSDSERFDEFSSLLQQKTGASEERARDLAGRLVTKEQIDDLTDSERKAISTQKTLNFAFGALESLDFLPLVGVTISKGAKLGKSSILNRILKDTNPISIARELKLANPVFNLGDVTTLSNDLSKTSNAKDAQSLIDNFVQTTQKAAAPQAPKRFSFSKAAQPDLAATRDVIIRRLEAEVPLNNKTTGVGAASRQASILNSDDVADAVSTALETLKKTPDPTLNQLNEAVQALRVSGRQADDVLADLAKVETPPVVTQRAGASDIKKPGRFSFAAEALKNPALRKGGFAGRVPEGFPGQRAAVRESVSSVDDSIPVKELTETGAVTDSRVVSFEVGRNGGTKVVVYNSDKSKVAGDILDLDKATKKFGTTNRQELADRMVNGRFNNKTEKWETIKEVAPRTTKAAKAPAVSDIVEQKAWDKAPAAKAKESVAEAGAKYSNTVTESGGISVAATKVEGVPPIKNTTTKARNFAAKEQMPIELPDETYLQIFQRQFQDSAARLGFLQKKLTESGVEITDDINAYMQREAYVGRAAAAVEKMQRKLGMQAGNTSGIFPRMRKEGVTVDDLGEYMSAKNASARNSRVSTQTDGKIPDGGSGITNKQGQEILDKWKANPKIEKFAQEFRDTVITPRLQLLKEAGILTQKQIDDITRYEPFYVPAKIDPPKGKFDIGKGFSVSSRGVKGIKGSTRTDRVNSVMQAVNDYENAIRLAEKNKSLTALAGLIRKVPDDAFWKVRGVKHVPQYDKTGELEFLAPASSRDDNVITFFEEGKIKEIVFADEQLARVFTEQGMTKPIPGLQKINNYLRSVNTVINPEFMISNAIRDLQTAVVLAGGEKGALVAAKMVRDYPKASKGIWKAVRKESNEGWSKTYNEMVEAGGRTGWFDMLTVPEQTAEVSKRINRYNSAKTSDSLMRAVDSTGKLISDMNEVAEMSVRVSAYKQLVDSGMSTTKAANYAKNMTVNFNKRGNLGLMLNSLYLFANAGIQGSARVLMAQKNPKVRRITYGIVASAYGMNELNNKINPEGYDRIQDFEKERNMIIMLPLDGNKYDLPGISGDPREGYYVKIPLPYGFNVFKVAGDAAYDLKSGRKTITEAMKQLLLATDAAFNPLSSGTPLQYISPTVADPFVQSFENRNWFGAPVMPEQPAFAPPERDSNRYFSGARDISVGTAQFLNRLTGGNEVTAGAVDISPETIDLMIDTLGGGLGNFLAQTVDGALGTVQGDIPTPDEMPFVRKLIDTPFETGEQSQVFETLDRSATKRMSQIEINRFVDSTIQAFEMGQIDEDTVDRVTTQFIDNAVNQEAGEVMSLIDEGKMEQAMEVLKNAPPGISKQLNSLIDDEIEKEIKKAEKELK